MESYRVPLCLRLPSTLCKRLLAAVDGAQPRRIHSHGVPCPTTWIYHILYKCILKVTLCLVLFSFFTYVLSRALSYQYLHHARSPYLINLPSFRGTYVVFNFLFYLNFSLRFLSISLKWSPRRGITGSKNRNRQGPTIGHPIIINQEGLMCPPSPRCVFLCICVYTHVQICTCATFSIWDSNTELQEQSPRTPGTWPHEDQGFKLLASGPTAPTEKGPGLNDQKNAPLRAHHLEHAQQSSRIHIDGHFSKGLGGGRVFLDMQVKIGATQQALGSVSKL